MDPAGFCALPDRGVLWGSFFAVALAKSHVFLMNSPSMELEIGLFVEKSRIENSQQRKNAA
ncbi:hypothetical protein MnTg02_03304 [bacterium MnTg02]|nr:hypothetical protein MnTg02_03304 [bacterium MnTg02]